MSRAPRLSQGLPEKTSVLGACPPRAPPRCSQAPLLTARPLAGAALPLSDLTWGARVADSRPARAQRSQRAPPAPPGDVLGGPVSPVPQGGMRLFLKRKKNPLALESEALSKSSETGVGRGGTPLSL